ncbi:MerC domain-containing protein [Blastopirellula marina]|uniref:Uncharacterized protein n=1 Tax=Blastopirellula marina DSM 3645 TaxID=314230 RepID=A3ZNK4_9BACT|nr:hypothetical protein DSM3645_17145 [Blastopirellula marina DSM 3645]
MPLAIGFLPMLGLRFLADESFHRWMAGACFVFALAAFVPGWRKHRRWLPSVIAICGLAVITSAAYGLSGECCETCAPTGVCSAELPLNGNDSSCGSTQCCAQHRGLEGGIGEDIAVSPAKPVKGASIEDMLMRYAALSTPLGGVLLISGHLLNRRYLFQCSCCTYE